jgi:DDE superfamily endonuclease
MLTLLRGTLLARGRRTVTAALWHTGHEQDPHFSTFHQVLNRARWSPLQASRRLLMRIIGDFNHQTHFAHQRRADSLRTPAEVLGGTKGRLVAVPTLQEVFALLLAQRTVDRSGYIRYDGWRVYGEEGLSGQRAGVWLAKETRTLTLSYAMQPVAQYDVTFGPASGSGPTAPSEPGLGERRTLERKKHEKRGQREPRGKRRSLEIVDLRERYAFSSPRPSLQRQLWDAEAMQGLEWRKVYRLPDRAPRRRRTESILLQPPLLSLQVAHVAP